MESLESFGLSWIVVDPERLKDRKHKLAEYAEPEKAIEYLNLLGATVARGHFSDFKIVIDPVSNVDDNGDRKKCGLKTD